VKQHQPGTPKGLSGWASGVWAELTTAHTFEGHELVVFERALRWWDVSDDAAKQAESAEGGELARLTKLSLDASTAALRHWRALKFPTPEGVRRPGRPADVNWSAKRRANA
jgi:hypothetical protein